ELAADEDRWKRLSAGARSEIQSRYSLALAADRWLEFCEKLLADAGHRAQLKAPNRLSLPRILPGLAAEDQRQLTGWEKLRNFAQQKGRGLKRRLSTWPGMSGKANPS